MLGATEDMACIVLELAKTDLYCLVKRLKLRTPIATFRDWSRQILESVAFLHENSVLHRVEPSTPNQQMPSPRPWKMIRYFHLWREKWTALSGPLMA